MGLREFFQRVASTVDRAYERRIRAASMVTEYHPGGHHEHHDVHAEHAEHQPEADHPAADLADAAASKPQQ